MSVQDHAPPPGLVAVMSKTLGAALESNAVLIDSADE
jgi:hypothetical protein